MDTYMHDLKLGTDPHDSEGLANKDKLFTCYEHLTFSDKPSHF